MSGKMPQLLTREQARSAATALAGLRVLVGAFAFLLPQFALRPWVGGVVADEKAGRLLGRSLGARDLALGAGVILSQRHDVPVRGWIEAGALSDTGDLVASGVAFSALPRYTRFGILAVTALAVVAGAVIAPCVDDGR